MKKEMMRSVCAISVVLFVISINFFDIISSISYSISISVFIYFLYDRFLWRFNPFNKIPKIYGCYETSIESTYSGGISYESLITIKQTLSKIIITEKMRDGICVSIVASLYKYNDDDDQWFLYYTYLTHPKNNEDDMHFGTSILYIKNKFTLEGFYFTNRVEQTKGKLVLKRVK